MQAVLLIAALIAAVSAQGAGFGYAYIYTGANCSGTPSLSARFDHNVCYTAASNTQLWAYMTSLGFTGASANAQQTNSAVTFQTFTNNNCAAPVQNTTGPVSYGCVNTPSGSVRLTNMAGIVAPALALLALVLAML